LNLLSELAEEYNNSSSQFETPDPNSPAAQAILQMVTNSYPDPNVTWSPNDLVVLDQMDHEQAGQFLQSRIDHSLI